MVLHQDGHALCIEATLDFENEFRFAGEKRFVLGALSFMCGLGKVLMTQEFKGQMYFKAAFNTVLKK